MHPRTVHASTELQTRRLAADIAQRLRPGDVILLDGPLGAGKTTFVRGFLEGLGYDGPVRSPTFNLIQTFNTDPPVMHADLYRVKSHDGIGLEEYLDTHICLVEWPDRAKDLLHGHATWIVRLEFAEQGRTITVELPPKPA